MTVQRKERTVMVTPFCPVPTFTPVLLCTCSSFLHLFLSQPHCIWHIPRNIISPSCPTPALFLNQTDPEYQRPLPSLTSLGCEVGWISHSSVLTSSLWSGALGCDRGYCTAGILCAHPHTHIHHNTHRWVLKIVHGSISPLLPPGGLPILQKSLLMLPAVNMLDPTINNS